MQLKAGMKSVAKWTAIGFGALTAAVGVFLKQSIDAAKDKLKADKLLETNLMKQANASKEHIKNAKKMRLVLYKTLEWLEMTLRLLVQVD